MFLNSLDVYVPLWYFVAEKLKTKGQIKMKREDFIQEMGRFLSSPDSLQAVRGLGMMRPR